MGSAMLARMKINSNSEIQLSLSLPEPSGANCRGRSRSRRRRLSHAGAWFQRMRQIVDQAPDPVPVSRHSFSNGGPAHHSFSDSGSN
jgi:hypothetical protein